MTSHINTYLEDPNIDKIKTGIEAVVADLASHSLRRLTPENVANMMFKSMSTSTRLTSNSHGTCYGVK